MNLVGVGWQVAATPCTTFVTRNPLLRDYGLYEPVATQLSGSSLTAPRSIEIKKPLWDCFEFYGWGGRTRLHSVGSKKHL